MKRAAFFLLLAIPGCSYGPEVYDYTFDGKASNFLGCGEGCEEDDFSGYPFDWEVNFDEGRIVFYSHSHTALVLLFESSKPLAGSLSTSEGSLEAWLLRPPVSYKIMGEVFSSVRGFATASAEARRKEPRAFRLEGTARMIIDGDRLAELRVDLASTDPMPLFEELIRIRQVLRPKYEGCRESSGKEKAAVQGFFKGGLRKTRFWPFI
jgi:hypothetical protein